MGRSITKEIKLVWVLLSLWITIPSCRSEKELLPKIDKEAVHFFVLGDWGRKGEQGQQQVANEMGRQAELFEPEFIVSTGDNFYPDGVASTLDYQWISSFENVYSAFSLNIPWYVVLGNHDYRGNVQSQIDYSSLSQRWKMPAAYFVKSWTFDEVSVRMIFLDTSPLNLPYYEDPKYAQKVMNVDTSAQLRWLDSLLVIDEYDWDIVVGHHPMYTGGKRANEPNSIRTFLEGRLEKAQVKLYLAGHEHDLQHIQGNAGLHHIVSGAGSEIRPTGYLPNSLYAQSINGFFVVSVKRDYLVLQAISHEGLLLHEYQLHKEGTEIVK